MTTRLRLARFQWCLLFASALCEELPAQQRTREVGRLVLGSTGQSVLAVSATNSGFVYLELRSAGRGAAGAIDPEDVPSWIDSAVVLLSIRPNRSARERLLYEIRRGDLSVKRIVDATGDRLEVGVGELLSETTARISASQVRSLIDTLRIAARVVEELTPGRISEMPASTQRDSVAVESRVSGDGAGLSTYLSNMNRQVRLRFRAPRGADREAQVMFLVHGNGSVSGLRFVRRSGSFTFDLEAQSAVEVAGQANARGETPFGPLPAAFRDSVIQMTIHFRTDTLTVRSNAAGETGTGAGSGNPVAPQEYFEFQVEKQVAPAPGNPALKYPDMLRSAKIEGEVLAQFVVDTTGRADMATFKVLKSSHDLFSQSVRQKVEADRYYPAEISGRKVRQLIQMPFNFTLSR